MQLPEVTHNRQRILTTEQIAAFYGTTPKVISNNFNRHKDRFIEGKHYFLLEGETLQRFKAMYFQSTVHQNGEQLFQADETIPLNEDQLAKKPSRSKLTDPLNEDQLAGARTPKLYLWTEKGALMHAKSLKTDEAWDACEKLVDDYYRRGEVIAAQQQTIATQHLSLLDEVTRLDQRLQELFTKQQRFLHDEGDLETTAVAIHRLTQYVGEMKAAIAKFQKTLSQKEYAQREDVAEMKRALDDAVYYVQKLQKTTELDADLQEQSLELYGFAGSALEALGQLPQGETQKQLQQAKEEEW